MNKTQGKMIRVLTNVIISFAITFIFFILVKIIATGSFIPEYKITITWFGLFIMSEMMDMRVGWIENDIEGVKKYKRWDIFLK